MTISADRRGKLASEATGTAQFSHRYPYRKTLRTIALFFFVWLWATPVFGQGHQQTDSLNIDAAMSGQSDIPNPFWVALKGGVAAFPLTSQSPALPHVLKPMARLEAGYRFTNRLGFGVEISAVVDGNSNYRLLSGTLTGRAAAYLGELFSVWLGWGVGAGNAPPILASDLIVTEDVALTVEIALQLRWVVVENLLSLGIDFIDQNIVVISTAATVQFEF
ncbi:MAG: hypothetical protein HUU55_23590 [Myxococcales bacterium]|nr:hypothetical protein [Myxococcales bacterium]